MLVFDEATSALDKKNEGEVQMAIDLMKEELGQVTSIIIAHRLSTIKRADRILVMKKGRIVEDGTHESLLRDYPDGVYSKLVTEAQNAEAEEAGQQGDGFEKQVAPSDAKMEFTDSRAKAGMANVHADRLNDDEEGGDVSDSHMVYVKPNDDKVKDG